MGYFRTPPRVPTRKEVDAVLAATDNEADARNHILVAPSAGTGLRVHELVALSWGQLLTQSGGIRRRVELVPENTKGGVGGDIVLNSKLRWKLERYQTWCARHDLAVEGDAPIFVSRHHRRLSVRMAQVVWKRFQEHVGIERPYNIHALRHYYGTAIYAATKDIRVTQVLLRHRSVTSTQIYAHVSERQVEEAAEMIG